MFTRILCLVISIEIFWSRGDGSVIPIVLASNPTEESQLQQHYQPSLRNDGIIMPGALPASFVDLPPRQSQGQTLTLGSEVNQNQNQLNGNIQQEVDDLKALAEAEPKRREEEEKEKEKEEERKQRGDNRDKVWDNDGPQDALRRNLEDSKAYPTAFTILGIVLVAVFVIFGLCALIGIFASE